MAKNYQSNKYVKNKKSKNSFERKKEMSLSETIEGERLSNLKDWITFYRKNPQIFVQHYMGLKLYPYQELFLFIIGRSSTFLALASRASAKSFLIAVYAVAKCILYPGSAISLSSSTKAQAGLIVSSYVQKLYDELPNVRREIKNITTNQNVYLAEFLNGSKIFVVIAKQSGRGNRATECVLEERALISNEVVDKIIRPFLVARKPPYMGLSQYEHLPPEEPKEIIISSVTYKSSEFYQDSHNLIKMLVEGNSDIGVIFLDYLISIKHGIKTRKQMIVEKDKADSISFSMEFQNIPFGGSLKSFYKSEFFNRTLKTPFLPRKKGLNWTGKNPYAIKRQPNEIRLMSCDIASRAGIKNDISSTTLWRLRATKKGYYAEIPYIETFSGINSLVQANRIKELFAEWTNFTEGDALILDVRNLGIGVLDALGNVTKGDSSDVEYPAITVLEHSTIEDKTYKELLDRTFVRDALPFVYPFSGSAQLNSTMATVLRDRLKKGLFSFLCNEVDVEESFIKNGNKNILSMEPWMKVHMLAPAIHTNLLVNEAISLEQSRVGDGKYIKLTEPNGYLKDRYLSLAMGNYYVSLLDQELLRDENEADDLDVWLGAMAVAG